MSISLKEISERIQFVDLYQDDMCCIKGTVIKDNYGGKRLLAYGWIHLWNNISSTPEKQITINNVTINDKVSFNGILAVSETGSAADQVFGTYLGNNTFTIGVKQLDGIAPDCRLNIHVTADIL